MAGSRFILMLSAAALAMPGAALAQAPQERDATVDEIIVTAQRRAESLTEVPLSIAAASSEALQSRGLETITDLRFETPGFISLSGTGYTQLYIRGIGNNIFVGADPSVATFIDDVPRVYGSLVDNFINVERVEVLKGAQGGLYGRNATGGVVNIITRQPDETLALRGRVTVGEYSTVDASAFVNLPLGERAAIAISGNRRTRDGYLKNIAVPNPYPPGTTSFFGNPNSPIEVKPLNNADFYAGDAKLRLKPTDNLTITLAGDYARKKDPDGNGWVQKDPAFNYLVYLGYAGAAGISNPRPAWPVPRKGEAYGAIDSYSWTEDYGVSGKIEFALSGVDLTSITAFRWNNSNFRGDIGAAPVPMAGFFTDFDRNNFYQELRFVSNGSGPLEYLGGATYYRDTIKSLLRGLFIGFPRPDTLSTVKTENWSVYGQLAYPLTDKLKLTASLRYVSETKDAFFPAQAGFPQASRSTKQDKLLPSATLSYDIGDGVVYARYARGFKTGGINPIVHPQPFAGRPGSEFGPETVDSFELGFRATLFDRRVQFTSAVFYNAYDGIQIARAGNAANPTISNAIIDIGTARTYGAEASITWQATPEFSLSANVGYLNARYKNAGYIGSPIVDPFDASGNIMALAPEWQGGISANYDQPIGTNWRIKANALFSFVSRYNYQYEERPLLFQPAYQVVNLRLGASDYDENIGLYLFVNNVFDTEYTIFGTSNSLGSLLTPAPPRVFGATLEAKF
jgi:iron complex outermembrane recepter protein